MKSAEEEIRELVATWMTATQAGDIDTVLSLMTDDVVFLVPGQPPMRKADFAAIARAQSGAGGPKFEGRSDIREIEVAGDWAFMWSELTVHVVPPAPAKPVTRAGHTLTVFRRERGRWLLARDANMLVTLS